MDYQFEVAAGKYIYVLCTDTSYYGGQGLIDEQMEHFTQYTGGKKLDFSVYSASYRNRIEK